jgi:hypothetical protein
MVVALTSSLLGKSDDIAAAPIPIMPSKTGDVANPTTTKTQAKTFTPIEAAAFAFTAKTIPITATTKAIGTNTNPKNKMPKTAKMQAIMPANIPAFTIHSSKNSFYQKFDNEEKEFL